MAKPTTRPQCTGCGEHLQVVHTGNIIHFSHNPASPTGALCPNERKP